jgi:transcription elongation GreA/GreB family factor
VLTKSFNAFQKWLESSLYRHYLTSSWRIQRTPLELALDISRLEQLWNADEKKSREAVECLVTLFDMQINEKVNLTLVSPDKSDPERGRISYFSLLGSKLLGSKAGDKVEISIFGRKEHFYVMDIKPCVPS